MGSSLFGGSKSTTTNDPWAPQGDQLKNSFTQAQDLYNQKKGTPFYEGELHAGLDPLTSSGISGVGDYVNGQGQTNAGNLTSTGNSLLSATPDYLRSIGAYGASASADPTQGNIASAGAYAANPYLDSAITAASRDVSRNLYENDLPTIDRAATGTGNINSTRAGIASGIAMRGAQDQIGDIASSMRSSAYQNGLGLAEQSRQANLTAQGNAAGLYDNAVSNGANAVTGGNSMSLGNLNAQIAAGQIGQQDRQANDDAEFSRWQGNDTRDQGLLQNYYNIIGANNWGGTTTSTQSSSPGILGGLLGGASSLLGMAKSAQGLGLFK